MRSLGGALTIGAAISLASCSDDDRSPTLPPVNAVIPASAFAVSEPIAASSLPSAGLALVGPNEPVVNLVYVSASPGELPQGRTVTITNVRTSASATAPIVDGGFDPVSIPAVVGDELKVTVTTEAGTTGQSTIVVNPRRPPRVVRTSPPKGRTDVPINRTVVVIFSEPVAPGTVNPTSIRLDQSGAAVSGSVRMVPGDDLASEFVPSSALLPSATYVLSVTQTITDLSGEALDSAVTAEFTTSASTAPEAVASISILPESTSTEPGESLKFTTLARDARGQFVTLPAGALTWVSSVPAAVRVDNEGTWHALGAGVVTVRAVSGRAEGRAKIVVDPTPTVSYTAVVAGTAHACALDANGGAYCWGANEYGQLGNGSSEKRSSPVRVKNPVPLVSLTAGGEHTCGLTAQGEAWCWGANPIDAIGSREGRVGCNPTISGFFVPNFPCTPTPVQVTGDFRFKQLAAAGTLFSWDNGDGLSTQDQYTCGLTMDGQLLCWGGVADAIVGTGWLRGGSGWSPTPATKGTDVQFTAVTGGAYHVCALAVIGDVYCWGSNLAGELGVGVGKCFGPASAGVQPCTDIPRRLDGVPSLASISAGRAFTCGLTSEGRMWCWGIRTVNVGTKNALVPGLVADRPAFAAMSVGPTSGHMCAITLDARAKCWGTNGYVSVTAGVLPPRPAEVPSDIANALRFRQIAAGATHGCGLSVGAAVYCWGSNEFAQLGRDGPSSQTAVRVGLP